MRLITLSTMRMKRRRGTEQKWQLWQLLTLTRPRLFRRVAPSKFRAFSVALLGAPMSTANDCM